MESLKEWATVVRALEDGKQTVILRKGGILEVASGFKVEAGKFLLFPTFEHQNKQNLKPKFLKYLEEVESEMPPEGYNRITSYAEVLDEADVSSDEKINRLSNFHIWSDSYIEERKKWKPEKPMKAIFLKVYKILPIDVPLKSEYQGCKSWIEINAKIDEGKPVLDEEKTRSLLKEFQEVVR